MTEHYSWLLTVPCTDTNFIQHLAKAPEEEIHQVIKELTGKSGVKTKLVALERELRRRKKAAKTA